MKKPNVVTLEAAKKEEGRIVNKNLRDQKQVPAVVYGPGIEGNVSISLSEIEVEKLLSVSEKEFVKIEVDGKEYRCLLYDVQFHPVTDRPLHLDLYATSADKPVTITVPLRLEGTPPGITEGGRLYQPLREIQIKCLPDNIPAEFVVDVSKLQIGNTLRVRRIKPKNLEILTEGQRTIVVVRPPKGATVSITELEDDEDDSEEAETEAEGAEAEA